MPDLADEAQARTGQPGPRCQVEVFLTGLAEEDRRGVVEILGMPHLATIGIYRTLFRLFPEPPSVWSLGNHRNRKCRCSRRR